MLMKFRNQFSFQGMLEHAKWFWLWLNYIYRGDRNSSVAALGPFSKQEVQKHVNRLNQQQTPVSHIECPCQPNSCYVRRVISFKDLLSHKAAPKGSNRIILLHDIEWEIQCTHKGGREYDIVKSLDIQSGGGKM